MGLRRFALLLGVLAIIATCARATAPILALPIPTSGYPPVLATAAPDDALPDFGHVWVIVLENKGYDRVVGAADAPYVNELIDRFGLARAYRANARPSQPNYFAMFSGSTHGVTDNLPHDLDAVSLADQLEAAGRTWREHAENVPPDCFEGAAAEGGRDGPGEYRRKHAPAISYTAIRTDPRRCALIQDLTAFEAGASDYALIIPNECHNGHDCPIAESDAWLSTFVPRIIDSAAFRDHGLLVLTFDEGAPGDPTGGHIATVVIGPDVVPGSRSAVPHDHFSLLRTIQAAWGLDCLAETCTANTLAEFFAPR